MDSQEENSHSQSWLGEGHLPVMRGLQLAHKLQAELCNAPPPHLYNMEEEANKTGFYTHDLLRCLLDIVSSLNDGIHKLCCPPLLLLPQAECTSPLKQFIPSHHHLKSQQLHSPGIAKALTKRSPRKLKRCPSNFEFKLRVVNKCFDDGFTWRKYGQKPILGKQHPRSYYRCIHKGDLNCPALKQVQQRDGINSCFDITYIEKHTCKGTYSNEGQHTRPNRAASDPLLSANSYTSLHNSTQELNASPSEPSPRVCGIESEDGVQDRELTASTMSMLCSMLEHDQMVAPPQVTNTSLEGTADNCNFAQAYEQHEAGSHNSGLPSWSFELFPAFADFEGQL